MQKNIGKLIMGFFWTIMLVFANPATSFSQTYEELKKEIKSLVDQNKALTERLKKVETELSELKEGHEKGLEIEPQEEGSISGFLTDAEKRINLSGLLEFGGAYRDTSYDNGEDVTESDLVMTTVELDFSAKLNKWVDVTGVLLYEDPTFESEETSFELDSASVVFGAEEGFPFTLTLGKVYVPFGALLTYFPDDPLIDSPLTLLLGESNEKTAILAYTDGGLTVSVYAYNGDVEEKGEGENRLESYGFDVHFEYGLDMEGLNFYKRGEKFKHDPNKCIDFLIGGSYISNLADSDFLSDALGDEIDHYVGGMDFYVHAEHRGYFIAAEFMGAVNHFSANDLSSGNSGAKPYVWNIETGFSYNWWKNLEVAFKIAGSFDTEALGLPERRYGINLNQELFEGVTLSLGYIHDQYHDIDIDKRDERELLYGQMAVEF
ncbi:hypothetical protein DBT_1458 [Dissulfuribacter thermophilus]|uniref:LbtU family siderophore porin n=1 Tax=Dissulfuribacter thermophilus TaxID=1156395 RepID=A0A1B9F4X5_9BACT|nr:LbtU family siderophore porin [Dissulfuribacter thermophilus]OCC14972.1 hypothetical protein DBT_1458 [Dissulfuribacter thermophilus]